MARFFDEEHQDRYDAVVLELLPPGCDPQVWSPSADWAACLFLLTAYEPLWGAIHPYVHTGVREIDWSKIRRLSLSHGQRFLVDLARYLYNGSGKPEWDCLWSTLDARNFDLAMAALQIRRHGEGILEAAEVVNDAQSACR